MAPWIPGAWEVKRALPPLSWNSSRGLPDYTLSITPDELVEVMKRMRGTVRWPSNLKINPNARDSSQYCAYYNDHGRKTEDYLSLRLEVFELLRKGHLTEFLSDKARKIWGQRGNEHRGEVCQSRQSRVINRTVNYITGGSEVSGVSRAAAKHLNLERGMIPYISPVRIRYTYLILTTMHW